MQFDRLNLSPDISNEEDLLINPEDIHKEKLDALLFNNKEHDFLWYCAFFGARRLYKYQYEIMRDFLSGTPVTAKLVKESGKTQIIIALSGLCVMAMYPGSKVVSTSGSWRQIEGQLLPTIRHLVNGKEGWRVTDKKVIAPTIRYKNVELTSQWEVFSTDDAGKAEGYHKVRNLFTDDGENIPLMLAYIIDEAKTVTNQGIWDAVGRCNPNFRMVCSSVGESFGPFYDTFNKFKADWNQHSIDWLQVPHLTDDPKERKRIEREIQIYGRNHPRIKSQYFSEWMDEGGYFVYNSESIKKAMSNTVAKIDGQRMCAVDYSDGGDEQVVMVAEGNSVVDMMVYREKNAKLAYKKIKLDFERWQLKPQNIAIDIGNSGDTFVDFLASDGWDGIVRYANTDIARDKVLYVNKYTEDAFALSRNLDYINIPNDETLERQMRERKYVMRNDDSNRIRLEPKTDIRRRGAESPDRLDCLIMLFRNHPYLGNEQQAVNRTFAANSDVSVFDSLSMCNGDGLDNMNFFR